MVVRLVAAVALAVLTVLPARAAVAAPVQDVRFDDADGIHVTALRRLDDRMYDLTVRPDALDRTVHVRLLLPAGYANTTARYPVLYLMHGTGGRASDWVNGGDAEGATAALPMITVMPDGGFDGDGGGWYTNWTNRTTALGPSQWETFHIGELIPWIDHTLRTRASRGGRAIAGTSQGGYGAMAYAARHPDMFQAAASFSGAPDIDTDPLIQTGSTAVVSYILAAEDGVDPGAAFGPRLTDEVNWRGHDPATLAGNLRATSLTLYTATGIPGPLDPPTPDPEAIGIEILSHISTLGFHRTLNKLGIPHRMDDYTFGTHIYPYWARDLKDFLIPLTTAFANPPKPPRTVEYASIDASWSQWGWSVAIRRTKEQEFSTLSAAGPTGFTLKGTGTATVTTPACYRPGATAHVTLGTTQRSVKVGRDGRLTLTVPLPAARVTVRAPQ